MELVRALGSLIESPAPEHRRIAKALGLPSCPGPSAHAAVVAFQRYPHASVHLGPEGMMGGGVLARIEGFRRALGVDQTSPPKGGASDHLAALLALLAALDESRRGEADPAGAALLEEARVTLTWEYLGSWLGPYLASFAGCGEPFYEAWAALLAGAMHEAAADMSLPSYLPAALREAPPLADPREQGGGAFVSSLLAPVRSGVLILRDDLARLGRETGLACRAGERRYALKAFLAQDAAATLGWLAVHAGRWERREAGTSPAAIASWWSTRAAATAGMLEELASDARVQSEALSQNATQSDATNAAS